MDYNDYDFDNQEKQKNSIIKTGIKTFWGKLPTAVKLQIIGGIAGAILILVILIIIISTFSQTFLDYSTYIKNGNDIGSAYSEYWFDFCEEGKPNCSEEQIEKDKELIESQKRFYDKLNKLITKENLSETHRYVVLSTIFYDFDITLFSEGNNAFTLDETDEINYSLTDVYKEETDSLKRLIRQFKVYTAYCVYDSVIEEETRQEQFVLRDPNNKIYSINFLNLVTYKLTGTLKKDGFADAQNSCNNNYLNGHIEFNETKDKEVSIENYYDYLISTAYFDEKVHLKSYFSEYAKKNGLDTVNLTTWPEDDLKVVRAEIVENIKEIVKEYEESDNEFITYTKGTSYWWPIGSINTTVENDRTFATGDPQYTGISSNYGLRVHPISGEIHKHSGIDIPGAMNETNIIATLDGVVTQINNSCASSNSNGCGAGYGNYVMIQDTKGNLNIYAHMYQNSLKVSIGDAVKQGEVIGKVGSSGNSTGPHLHYEIRINGQTVDPLDYVNPNSPRPITFTNTDFTVSRFTKEEFTTKLKNYYSREDICQSSKAGCISYKNDVLSGGAETIYDIGLSYNVNPEIFVARTALEGYSPGTNYNYFGFTCYNSGSASDCSRFKSFNDAVDSFYKNVSRYTSLEEMMSKYAYLGDYWYTGKHWSLGGCAYADYIYPDGLPDRVSHACSYPDGYCSKYNTSKCIPTTLEDKNAYTAWQVSKMNDVITNIFGG